MSNSRSFDRAVDYYDQTRALPEAIAQDGIQAILDIIGPSARVLEVGAGTGRISVPLLERGVNLIGCDLSLKMLRRLKEKLASARLTEADGSQLPFPASSFGVLLTVHVLHLIPPWREALREFRRVLQPYGVYLNVSTGAPVGETPGGKIRDFWRGWMAANGVKAGHLCAQRPAEILEELRSLEANVSEVEAVRFPYRFNLRAELDRFASRLYSETWDLPEGIFDASMKELRAWAASEYGDLDRELEDEVRFVINVARFNR